MMPPAHYRLWDDMPVPNRWVLGNLREEGTLLAPGQLIAGKPVNITMPLSMGVLESGQPLDYSIDPRGTPVVTRRAAELLAPICGQQLQLIEVSVEGHPGPFFVANATRTAHCLDESRSRGASRWTAEDGQPERIGDYHAMDKLIIDPGRTGGLDLFRVAHYTVALIVSERLKNAMEEAGLLGPSFEPVT